MRIIYSSNLFHSARIATLCAYLFSARQQAEEVIDNIGHTRTHTRTHARTHIHVDTTLCVYQFSASTAGRRGDREHRRHWQHTLAITICMCDMTHSCGCLQQETATRDTATEVVNTSIGDTDSIHLRSPSACVTWLIHLGDCNRRLQQETATRDCNKRLLHKTATEVESKRIGNIDSIHLRSPSACVTWHLRSPSACVTWLIHVGDCNKTICICDMTHSSMWLQQDTATRDYNRDTATEKVDKSIKDTDSIHLRSPSACVTWLIHVGDCNKTLQQETATETLQQWR